MNTIEDTEIDFDTGICRVNVECGEHRAVYLIRISPWNPDVLTSYLTVIAEHDCSESAVFRAHASDGQISITPYIEKPGSFHELSTNLEWVANMDEVWGDVRTKRNRLLTASDWTQLPDVPLTTKQAWAVYRQALRDITLQPDPFNIVWPVAPG